MRKAVGILVFLVAVGGVFAQGSFPGERSFISIDAGSGSSDVLVEGLSFGLFLDPKLSITPAFTIGSKNGLHFSTDEIIALETQIYFRWNFLRLGKSEDTVDIFVQGGGGFLGAFKGTDVLDSRSSLLGDVTAGVTIPLSSRWHIEPSIRGGYPFIFGAGITAGYKFPLTKKTIEHELEYVEVIRTLPPNEIIKRIMITQVEYILFAPDSSRFNTGLDHDARALNELVIDHVSQILKENPDFRIRIEGHSNPVTNRPGESEELLALSSARANEVSRLLKEKGVGEGQIVIIAHGGARVVAAASDHDHWNMNRRVELIMIQLDAN
ncbi:MAG: OmpA family protein [Treponema sp.]|jgi:outer membrane protein OmpA-like peptidoglycan-associated protein|nr:OmpA family protein [Treponema sp.]